MLVGVVEIKVHLHGLNSLKGKRQIIKSIIKRVRNNFNVSASEVDEQDNKLGAVIGVSMVSNDSRYLNSRIDKLISFMRSDGRFVVGQIERDIF
jgi:hypothetical protein